MYSHRCASQIHLLDRRLAIKGHKDMPESHPATHSLACCWQVITTRGRPVDHCLSRIRTLKGS